MTVLALDGLEVVHRGVSIVEDLGFELEAGEVLALVGESGSGKSTVAKALVDLLPDGFEARWRRLEVDGGAVTTRAELAGRRGRTLALMPQDAGAALNPVRTIGSQIVEVLQQGAGAAPDAAVRLLGDVGFAEPRAIAETFPHRLSGGMRQRALLAATLAADPKILLVDEPTSALDPTHRDAVLALLASIAKQRAMAVLLITHDLAAAQRMSNAVAVLYAGRLAEVGTAKQLFDAPRHPYSAALQAARLDRPHPTPLEGALPALTERLGGCRFGPRCSRRSERCAVQPARVGGLACHHPLERS